MLRNGIRFAFFVTNIVDFEYSKYGAEKDASRVETHSIAQTIIDCCDVRGDELAYKVKGKIEFYSNDLPAADCVYHRSCSIHFRTQKNIPLKYRNVSMRQKAGRPVNQV